MTKFFTFIKILKFLWIKEIVQMSLNDVITI